jgi:DNA ligase 1
MFKPMLACNAPKNLEKIQYPILASPKLDGIRCIIHNGEAVSRNLKPIPNDYIRDCLGGGNLPDGLDGELIVNGGFNSTQSGVMRKAGKPDFTYHVFDWYDEKKDFTARIAAIDALVKHSKVEIVEQLTIKNEPELLALEKVYLGDGYEGAMIRSVDGPYKCGRSTQKQGYLMKLKRFEDAEAILLDVIELMHNENEAKKNVFGRTERSSSKEGKVPAGTMGALSVVAPNGVKFEIGTGFTAAQRQEIWDKRKSILGDLVKYKFQPDKTAKRPRFPVFLSFRHKNDLS